MSARAAWTKLFGKRTAAPTDPTDMKALQGAMQKHFERKLKRIYPAGTAPAADWFTAELALPPKDLSPNVSGGFTWAVKARVAKKYRGDCWYAIYPTKPIGWEPCRVLLDVEYRCPRGADGYVAFDVQNAISALKHGVDALSDLGIVLTDSHHHLSWGDFRLITQAAAMKGKTPGVTITVRKIT